MNLLLYLSFLVLLQLYQCVEFKILHINDMHARVEGMKSSGGCVQEENDKFECDGGWARLTTAAKQFVAESDVPIIFIDNGDIFSGEEASTLKNIFCEEVGFLACITSLGNHEFDFGYDAVTNYVETLTHDVIVSNLQDDCSEFNNLLGTQLKKSVIIEVEGIKIGFIGYVISSTPFTSSPPDCLRFLSEIEGVEAELTALEEDEVDIIVLTGHAGLEKEVELASIFEGRVDLIISGHSHSFLWDEDEQGDVPFQSAVSLDDSGELEFSKDTPVAPYPTFADQAGTVPVFQAFFGSRYLGAVALTFSENGILQSFARETVILSNSRSEVPDNQGFEEDPEMQNVVNTMLQPLLSFINTPVGKLPRDLSDSVDGIRRVRQSEMPLGNFACDAMLSHARDITSGYIEICMQNGGGIRAPLLGGDVTFGELITVFPFGNVVAMLNFTGERIHRALEFSLSMLPEENGGFLHVSRGFQVIYDPLLEPFSRVINITLNGELIENDDSRIYGIVTNAFTAGGGDGYEEIFSGADVISATGEPQENVLADFLASSPEICPRIENRIVPINNPVEEDGKELDLLGLEFDNCEIKFTILHINDVHARVEGMVGGGGCTKEQNENFECDGGWPRIAAAAKRLVDEADNPVIFVDNGDEFSGTVWSTFYEGREASTFLNQLCRPREEGGAGFLACFSGIGNHEFDFGYTKLRDFAEDLNHKLLSANINDECPPPNNGLGELIHSDTTLEIQGKRVGFLGYTLKETADISNSPGCIVFQTEERGVSNSLDSFSKADINLIIAVGHSGLTKDLDIATQFSDIDLIVGGHSHTFLWDEAKQGPIPAHSKPVLNEEGDIIGLNKDALQSSLNLYPRIAAADENETPVLQAFFGSRYLGAIELVFDFEGNLLSLDPKTVLLANENSLVAGATEIDDEGNINTNPSKGFAEDRDMKRLVVDLLKPLEDFSNSYVGEMYSTLDTSVSNKPLVNMGTSEMPLGNLVCDAMVHNFNSKDGVKVDVCMQNAGGIRGPLLEGPVTFGQVIEVHPFGNVLSVVEFTTERLFEACEFAVSNVEEGSGRFLQYSRGFKLLYDPFQPVGQRIVSITVNDKNIDRNSEQTFNVVTNNFLAKGGDQFGEIFTEARVIVSNGPPQADVLASYLSSFCPTCAEYERRIVPLHNPVNSNGEVVDLLGARFATCEGIESGACILTDEEDEGNDTRRILSIVFGIGFSVLFIISAFAIVYSNLVLLQGSKEKKIEVEIKDSAVLDQYTL